MGTLKEHNNKSGFNESVKTKRLEPRVWLLQLLFHEHQLSAKNCHGILWKPDLFREGERSALAWLRKEASCESWYHSLVLKDRAKYKGSPGGGPSRTCRHVGRNCVGGALERPERLRYKGDKTGNRV